MNKLADSKTKNPRYGWQEAQFFLVSLAQLVGATSVDISAMLKMARRVSLADEKRILSRIEGLLQLEHRQACHEALWLLNALESGRPV